MNVGLTENEKKAGSNEKNPTKSKPRGRGYVSHNQKSKPTVYFLDPLEFNDLKYEYFVNTRLLNTLTHFLSVHVPWAWKERECVSD